MFAWLLIASAVGMTLPAGLLAVALIATVLAAVHHAELVAHRVGEPFGTFLLAIAVTIIELGLIITLMSAAGPDAASLARDTVFAAVMIILNGLIGACIFFGAIVHKEQSFKQTGVSASLATLCALTVLTLVLPNFTVSEPGPVYSPSQLGFVAIVSFLLYATFVAVQTVRHRDYFLPAKTLAADEDIHADPPTNAQTLFSAVALLACLGAVVLLAKTLAPTIEAAVASAGAPRAGLKDALFVALAGIGGDGHHRNCGKHSVLLHGLDQVDATDMRQLDVHDHEIRREHPGLFQRQPPIAHTFDGELVRAQQVGEKLEVQFIVLNNHHLF